MKLNVWVKTLFWHEILQVYADVTLHFHSCVGTDYSDSDFPTPWWSWHPPALKPGRVGRAGRVWNSTSCLACVISQLVIVAYCVAIPTAPVKFNDKKNLSSLRFSVVFPSNTMAKNVIRLTRPQHLYPSPDSHTSPWNISHRDLGLWWWCICMTYTRSLASSNHLFPSLIGTPPFP